MPVLEDLTHDAPSTLDSPTLEGFGAFPGRPFVIRYPDGRHACYRWDHYEEKDRRIDDGLACFRTENAAILFNDHVGNASGGEVIDVTFDEAREIALALPHLNCLLLLDDMAKPEAHYVRSDADRAA